MIRKVKNWLGIESVKVELIMPETFSIKEGKVVGKLLISSQSEQHVEGIRLVMTERYARGRRKSKLIDEYKMGELQRAINADIDEGHVISEDFVLHFDVNKSGIDRFGDRNIIYGGLSALAKLVKNAKSTYYITVEVDVSGNKLKPYDKMELVAD